MIVRRISRPAEAAQFLGKDFITATAHWPCEVGVWDDPKYGPEAEIKAPYCISGVPYGYWVVYEAHAGVFEVYSEEEFALLYAEADMPASLEFAIS